MKPISLLLTNQHGDELGRMRLTTLQVAEPGEQTANNRRSDLAPQMTQLYERLRLALAQEGFEANGDRLDMQIRVSRALLDPPAAGDEILIPFPVHPTSPPVSSQSSTSLELRGSSSAAATADPAPEDWDDLFDLSLDTDGPERAEAAGQGDPERDVADVHPARPSDAPDLNDLDDDLDEEE